MVCVIYLIFPESEMKYIKEECLPGAMVKKIIFNPDIEPMWCVPELEDPDVAAQIEVLNTEVQIIAKYHSRLPALKWAHTQSNGIDSMVRSIDPEKPLPTFTLTKTPGSINAVLIKEYVLAYILAREREIIGVAGSQEKKKWGGVLLVTNGYIRTLPMLTIGLLGVGGIGKEIAKVCKLLGMTVWGVTRRPVTMETRCSYVDEYRTTADIGEVLQNCDYICSSLPSTKETVDLLSVDILAHCQTKKSVLINIGRGDVINEESIVKAVRNGWIGGAVLDVLRTEPLPVSSPLWDLPGVVITSHMSGYTICPQYLQELGNFFHDNYQLYRAGKPLNNTFSWTESY